LDHSKSVVQRFGGNAIPAADIQNRRPFVQTNRFGHFQGQTVEKPVLVFEVLINLKTFDLCS
jgi:hypothetical protein